MDEENDYHTLNSKNQNVENQGENLFGADFDKDYHYDSILECYENIDNKKKKNVLDEVNYKKIENEINNHNIKENIEKNSDTYIENKKFKIKSNQLKMGEPIVNLENFNGPLLEWLNEKKVRDEVKRKFRRFLINLRDNDGNQIYIPKIKDMCISNRSSIKISYLHISASLPTMAIWIADCPHIMLKLFNEVATQCTEELHPGYKTIKKYINVRLHSLPVSDKLRDLRHLHLNMLIKVTGVVTRCTRVFPKLDQVKYDCTKCGLIMGPFLQRGKEQVRPINCQQCNSKGPFKLNISQTIYKNYQRITLQEPPGSVPAGRVPRSRQVILLDEIVDMVRPGEQIDVTGIYTNQFDISININSGFPVFTTVIEANNLEYKQKTYNRENINDDDEEKILELSKNHNLSKLIIDSIAPSIYGYNYIKQAIAFALFGGIQKESKEKHKVRGDINILILGDPGVGKSQFLKWVEIVAPRAIYTTGKGSTAVGLTAGVRKDPLTNEWTLEGGALVLADKGVCVIDEFDKMSEKDRTSIHEAMEQQTISISKAGIVASLQARCSVIAAANPINGNYDSSLNFIENVNLSDPLLSRFDILALIKDTVDLIKDDKIASWVVDNHINFHPDKKNEFKKNSKKSKDKFKNIEPEMLKKYIMYSKEHCKPKLNNINKTKITKFYTKLRQKSTSGNGIPIAVRHIESILRMAEANAKIHLRDTVSDEDVDIAIHTMLLSFIAMQKQSIKTNLKKEFQDYLTFRQDNTEILMYLLQELVADRSKSTNKNKIDISLKSFKIKANKYNININPFLNSKRFINAGYIYSQKENKIYHELN